MNDLVASIIRTYIPIAVAAVVAFLANTGVILTDDVSAQLANVLGAIAGGAYYAIVRVLEGKFPWVGKLLGTSKKPVYTTPDAKEPYTTADLA